MCTLRDLSISNIDFAQARAPIILLMGLTSLDGMKLMGDSVYTRLKIKILPSLSSCSFKHIELSGLVQNNYIQIEWAAVEQCPERLMVCGAGYS